MKKKLHEGRLEDLINQKDLAAFEQAASRIMDDLTSDGFEEDDVRDYLIKKIYSSEEKHAGDIAGYEAERDSELSADQAAMYKEEEYIYENAGVSRLNPNNKMKKGLINEAFRLQQLAGIAPVNEIFDTDNDQYMGKYADAYSRISVSNEGEYSANDPSDEEAVKLADALTALYDEHGENGVDAWQAGAIDIEDFMNESAPGL